MRAPRLRLTVGGLMVLVLVVGLASWKWIVPWLRTPRSAERAAQAGYAQALLTREVAEYALTEYDQGIFKPDRAAARTDIATAQADLERAAARLRSSGQLDERDPRLRAALDLATREQERTAIIRNFAVNRRNAFQLDIARARAAEAKAKAAYQAERTKRWRIPGLGMRAGN